MRCDLAATSGVALPDLEVFEAKPEDVTDEVRALLLTAQAWADGDVEVGDWLRMHEKNKVQLFLGKRGNVVEAVMLTEFVLYPRRKALVILALAGRGRQFSPFLEFIERWAKLNNASVIEAYCREAMVRYTRPLGFREVRRVIRKYIGGRYWNGELDS